MARSKVIEVENTHNRAGGTINPIDNIVGLEKLAKKYNLYFHLDGARLWNASVATGISPEEYASHFDSVSCCLSKGLGAPIGSVIAGSKDFITEAFRVRKAWGGGMRQVGVIAAAGLFALKNNIDRLSEDHEKAKILADYLSTSENFEIDMESVQTNILSFRPTNKLVEDVLELAKSKGLILSVGSVGYLRAVTHMDVTFEQIEEAKSILEKN
jgi:threonine aldolase